MSVTAQQIFNAAMDLLDERNSSGSFTTSDIQAYEYRAPNILTMAQAELIEQGEIFSNYEVTNSPVLNQLGTMFDVVEFTGTDLNYTANASKAYYFEVDSEATVYIEESVSGSWNTLTTISVPNTVSDFTAYSGVITASVSTSDIRIRFSGSYFYRIRNIALFEYSFQASKIPVYKPWVPKSMPSDFKSIDKIVQEDSEFYIKQGDYKWEEKNKLYVSYDFEGNIRIVYHPIPTVITALSDTLQVDDVTAFTVMPYLLATKLILDENPELASYFNQRYTEMKAQATRKKPEGELPMKDFYGITDMTGA
jgi:hypothetical protein